MNHKPADRRRCKGSSYSSRKDYRSSNRTGYSHSRKNYRHSRSRSRDSNPTGKVPTKNRRQKRKRGCYESAHDACPNRDASCLRYDARTHGL